MQINFSTAIQERCLVREPVLKHRELFLKSLLYLYQKGLGKKKKFLRYFKRSFQPFQPGRREFVNDKMDARRR